MYKAENSMRKGEIACYSFISLLRQNAVLCGNGLKSDKKSCQFMWYIHFSLPHNSNVLMTLKEKALKITVGKEENAGIYVFCPIKERNHH